jgi:hypothetical protein
VVAGPFLATALAVLLLWLLHPAPGDLQAAIAREDAAASGVGPTYWFAWYGGISPGSYSLVVPALSLLTGSAGLLYLATLAMGAMAVPLARGTAHPVALSWAIAGAAVLNTGSGRVAFATGAALALAGVLLVRRGRPGAGAALLAVAGLASPLAPAFAGMVALPLLANGGHRSPAVRAVLGGAGLGVVLPVVLFGAPGEQSFPWTTLAWMAAAALPAGATLRGTAQHRLVPLLAGVTAVLFVVPTGVGSNLSRFACLVLPCVCLAWSRWDRRPLLLCLVPAFCCGVYVAAADQVAGGGHPATDYDGLRTALEQRADLADHRVELVDNATRAGSHLLGSDVALARGWENQSDARYHALFHTAGALDATSYRRWLRDNAVGYVAVAADPLPLARPEADLVRSGLPYLTQVWHDDAWTLYRVDDAAPIVPEPLALVSSSPDELVVAVPDTRTHRVQVRPNRYLVARSAVDPDTMACLAPTPDGWLTLRAPAAGTYVLAGEFALSSVLGDEGCD